jgi:hypothetical protein
LKAGVELVIFDRELLMNNRYSISDNLFVLNQKPDCSRQVLRKAKLIQYHVQMAQI